MPNLYMNHHFSTWKCIISKKENSIFFDTFEETERKRERKSRRKKNATTKKPLFMNGARCFCFINLEYRQFHTKNKQPMQIKLPIFTVNLCVCVIFFFNFLLFSVREYFSHFSLFVFVWMNGINPSFKFLNNETRKQWKKDTNNTQKYQSQLLYGSCHDDA